MRILVGVLSVALIVMMLAEFFITFLLPRRVKRVPRIARQFFAVVWRPWRAVASRLPRAGADTMLGFFGPLGLLFVLGFLSAGVILGFAGLHWADRSHLGGAEPASFGNDLYFSAGSFFTVSTAVAPTEGGVAKLLQILEGASGFAVLFISIGYLPALFQAFSRRETAITQLDPRAGSPPTAGALIERSGERGWNELDGYLREWENWAAEVMETQLSYPIIGWFRSQHVNQNWLAALTSVLDACAFAMAYAPGRSVGAEMTFAIGRHALADLAFTYRAPIREDLPDRLPDDQLRELIERVERSGLEVSGGDDAKDRLDKLRTSYDKFAIAISERLALALPGWLPGDDAVEYWRLASAHHPRDDHH